MFGKHFSLESIPDHSTIHRREKGKKFKELINKVRFGKINHDKPITIAIDSSGVKVSNSGEWIRKYTGKTKDT